MSGTILIKDGIVSYMPESGIRNVSLSEFLSNMSNTSSVVAPILPSNCLGIISYPNYTCFVIQQEPRTQIMKFGVASTEREFLFHLHMPWVYYFVTVQSNPVVIQSVCLAYANQRVVSEDSKMGFMATPNVNSPGGNVGSCCLGEVRLDNNLPVNRAIEDLISKIVSSEYNFDLFEPLVQQTSPFLLNAYEDYGDRETIENELSGIIEGLSPGDALLRVPDNDIIKYLISNYHSSLAYLYSWQKKSEEIPLNDFVSSINWRQEFVYKEALEYMEKGIRNERRV